MDNNQFPRRICGLALCLIAIEIGISYSTPAPVPKPKVEGNRVEKIVAPHSPPHSDALSRPSPSS